jgi:serine/threonine-protein kinase
LADLRTVLQAGLAGSYALERELGGGGMSRVFLATETALGRRVVLKVLPPELGAGFNLERFRREIQLAASLTHPHIVPLYSAGQAGDLPYYTMPFIEGESLRARLARDGELPIGEAVRLLHDVVDALACAHEHGVVHRDIKPDNVMVSRHHALVTDFGVAKALEISGQASITSTGMALGTPAYMAPEQAAGDPQTDHRTDLYAVGVMAYEMLTGHPPFVGPTAQAVLAAQVTQAPPVITLQRPTIPPALGAVVMRCLEKRPADRWQSASELLHQLESMATPTGGTSPVAVTSAVTPGGPPATSPDRPAAAPPAAATPPGGGGPTAPPARLAVPINRAAYLVLGSLLVLATAWLVTRHQLRPTATSGARRLVVLPFENLGDSSRQYFANGVTEAITTQLTGLAGLSVIPRSTAFRYKGTQKTLTEIGRELGVSYVLEGTVQWEESKGGAPRVRVSPELIRVSDTTSVWAHGYDAVMASVFQVYSDVAQEVARALEVALNDPERRALAVRPTANTEAYDLYLRAKDYRNRGISAEVFHLATPMLERAVALDSGFALAWGELSEDLALSHWLYINRTDETLARARFAAERALALQPELPEAHRAMGNYYYRTRDYPRALTEFAIVQRSQPNSVDLASAVGYVERRQGRWEEAVASLRRSAELDPGSSQRYFDLGETFAVMRRYSEAIPTLQHGVEIAPDEPDSYAMLADAFLQQSGDLAQAQAVLRRALSRMPASRLNGGFLPSAYAVASDDTLRRAFEALSPAEFGSDTAGCFFFRAELRRLAKEPAPAGPLYDSARVYFEKKVRQMPDDYGFHARLGLAYARLGRFGEAIREGQKAVELLPPARDAYFGVDNVINLGTIYAIAGKSGKAVEQIASALAVPSTLSVATLRVNPVWDPIRGDPGFRKMVGR